MVAAGGAATPFFTPDSIRCRNSGSSYSSADVEWTCSAQLPSEFKLGSTDVVCEGYDNSDDEYVLKGSCGVEYRLAFTDIGEERYRSGKPISPGRSGNKKEVNADYGLSTDSYAAMLFWIVFLAVAGWIVLGFVRSILNGSRNAAPARRAPRRDNHGGNNYHDNDDDDDAPPPYSPRPPRSTRSPKSKTWTRSNNAGWADRVAGTVGQNAQGWRPGFWTGAVGGALAGMAAGSRRNQAQAPEMRQRQDAGEGPSTRRPTSASNSGTGATSSSFSETRYESTGFGGSRRR